MKCNATTLSQRLKPWQWKVNKLGWEVKQETGRGHQDNEKSEGNCQS